MSLFDIQRNDVPILSDASRVETKVSFDKLFNVIWRIMDDIHFDFEVKFFFFQKRKYIECRVVVSSHFGLDSSQGQPFSEQ